MPTTKAEIQEWRKEISKSASVEIENTQKSLAENFRIAIDKKEFTVDDIKGLMSDDLNVAKKAYRKVSLAFHPDKAPGKGLDPNLYTMFVSYNEFHMKPTTDELNILSGGIKAEIIIEKALATIENSSDISLNQNAAQNAAKDAEILRALDEKFRKEAQEKEAREAREAQERADADMARQIDEKEKAEEALRIEKQKKAEQEKRDAMLAKAIADEQALEDYDRSKEQAREEAQSAQKAQELAQELAAEGKVQVEEVEAPVEEVEVENVHMHMPVEEPEINLEEEQAKADQKAAEEARNWQATMDLLAQEEAEERAARQRRNNP